MGTIRGPYSRSDWITMLLLKEDIEDLSRLDDEKYKDMYKHCIKREKKTLREYMRKEATQVASTS